MPQVGIPIVFLLALLTALVASSLAQAAPSSNPYGQSNVYNYVVKVEEEDAKVCVGQTIDFIVTVVLDVTWFDSSGVGHTNPTYYTGERVVPTIIGAQIGTISPTALSTSDQLGGNPLAPIQLPSRGRILASHQRMHSLPLVFTFTATEKGTTTIEFAHTERARIGVPLATHTAVANVEVTDCWEAYATGLWTGNVANNWTQKDICSLERPFLIEGNGASVGGGAIGDFDSKAFFFWPMGQPFGVAGVTALQNGSYIYVGEITINTPAGAEHCTRLGSGTYEQIFYESRVVREGNLILFGSSNLYCSFGSTHFDNEVIEVAFRALPEGEVCQESLP
jgi:hypothetical protein